MQPVGVVAQDIVGCEVLLIAAFAKRDAGAHGQAAGAANCHFHGEISRGTSDWLRGTTYRTCSRSLNRHNDNRDL
jgi:hypothetical protein